jgi:hypothetical protein
MNGQGIGLLNTLKGLSFQIPFVQQQFARGDAHLAKSSTLFVLSMSSRRAVAFDSLMRHCDGNPLGVEYKQPDGDQWAFVLEDASDAGKFRVQRFDAAGFFSHSSYRTLTEAVEEMVREGYTAADTGALDVVASLPTWAKGMDAAWHIQAGAA